MMLSQAGLTVHEELLVSTTGTVVRTVKNLQIGEGWEGFFRLVFQSP